MADENITASENTTETNEQAATPATQASKPAVPSPAAMKPHAPSPAAFAKRLRSVLQPPPDSPKPISRPPKRSAVSPMTAPCS